MMHYCPLQPKQISSFQGNNMHKQVKEADAHMLNYFPMGRLAFLPIFSYGMSMMMAFEGTMQRIAIRKEEKND